MINNNSNPNINSGMTQEQFQLEAGRFFWSKVMPLLKQKGAQYSTQKAFANFEEGSALHRITPGKYLMIQATKHWHNLCKNPDNNSRALHGHYYLYALAHHDDKGERRWK